VSLFDFSKSLCDKEIISTAFHVQLHALAAGSQDDHRFGATTDDLVKNLLNALDLNGRQLTRFHNTSVDAYRKRLYYY
jgi:hypothetical protein